MSTLQHSHQYPAKKIVLHSTAASEAEVMSAKSNKREHEEGPRDGRMIPIHVRFVPKDIWLRLHIDSRSTVGAVKDSVLDKLQMPSFDPTVLPGFYDDARYAMIKPAFHPMEARAFPKAFLARSPKRNVAEVVQSDSRRIIGGELWDPIKPSAGIFNAKLKGKGSLALARELLGGDPGDGGMGSMSYVGNMTSTKSPSKMQDIGGKGDFLSSASSSPTTSKLLKSVRGAKSPRLRTSMLSLGAAAKGPPKDLLYDPEKGAPSDLLHDPTVAAGLDAYVDDLPVTLVGNVDALRKEEVARTYLERIGSKSPISYAPDEKAGQSARRARLTTHSSTSVSSSIHEVSLTSQPDQTDLELDDSSDDDDSVQSHSRGAATKSLLSSGSDSSIRSIFGKSHLIPSRFKKRSHVKVASLLGGTNSSPDVNAAALGHAAASKSGNLLAGPDAQGWRTSALMMRINSDMSVSSHPLSLKAATSSSSSSLNQSREQHGHGSEGGKASMKGAEGDGMSHSGSGNSRIAGIQLDEISAWKDAQHALSKFFCVYSYSNGHLLEDWRTVTAFRIRPYELLEIQCSNPRDRIHLPRGVGLDHLSIMSSTAFAQRPSAASLVDVEGSQHYIAPCCEGWCYLFKRNSGNNKAQRAGLGVWKLRYIVVRGSRLAIYRKKPNRNSTDVDSQDTLIWNLNAIECVLSERADGWTRPSLMPLQGLSSDIVTLVFPAEASPPAFVNNETMGWTSTSDVSISMRFISQLDTVAFFNTFARATTTRLQYGDQHRIALGANEFRRKVVTRATIAGRGGSVLPGRAGREGGRNAMARSRIRPAGVSREFDDVDRWSSHSEEEGNDKVLSSKGFKYSDLSKGDSKGSNKDLKADFFDPSYNVGQANLTMAPMQAPDHISPRGPMAKLLPDEKPNSEAAAGLSDTMRATRPSGESDSKAATRSRGFSFAKAARKALAPSDSSGQSLYQRVSPTMPVRPGSAQEGSIGATDGNRKERRSTQPDLAPATSNTSNADEMSEYAASSNNSEQRAPSPVWQIHAGASGRFSQLMSYPSASNGGRHRSYTLASPSSPPPSSGNRRSMGMRTNSSSSGGNSFHWPFRAPRPKSPVAVESSQLIEGIEGIDYGGK